MSNLVAMPVNAYDAAGNLSNHPRMGSFGYDAENRMVTATVSGVASSYAYDGDGRRVQATVGSSSQVFIYSASGELMAETASTSSGQRYLTVDGLGSTRMVTDAGGNVMSRHDYEPFGEELISTTNPTVRTTANGYVGPEIGVRQAFTGKERDAETGLDYFGARYMSSAQGRFTSTDPKQFSMRTIVNPQKWNKYAYTLNNPLALVDPDGREEVTITYRAFIPSARADVAGFGFRGDNRTFSTAATASSRIAISVRVETDPSIRSSPLIGTPQVSVGQTERFSPFGKVDTATTGLPTAGVSRDANGSVVVKIDANTKNPLFPLPEPGIHPNLTVTIPTNASSATVTGQTSAFPSQEINGTVGNTTNPLFQFPSSTSPFDLFKTVNVNQTPRPLPQCTTDANGKKNCQ